MEREKAKTGGVFEREYQIAYFNIVSTHAVPDLEKYGFLIVDYEQSKFKS